MLEFSRIKSNGNKVRSSFELINCKLRDFEILVKTQENNIPKAGRNMPKIMP